MRASRTVLTLALALGLVAFAQPQDAPPAPDPAETTRQAVVDEQLPSYPLTTCPISGGALGSMGKPYEYVHDGHLILLCCKGCLKKISQEEKARETIGAIEAAVIEQQLPSYPLDTCPISGEELGGMGDPIDYVHGTRLIRLCCKGCIAKVEKDPTAPLAKINTALIEAQKATYPTDRCVISGEALDSMGDPVDLLYGVTLVRLCCEECLATFHEKPRHYLAALDKLRAAQDSKSDS